MSRSSHHQRQLQLQQQQQQMAENDAAALAAEIFDHFCVATTMRQTLGLYRNMCDTLKLRPGPLNEFYPKLKAKIRSWKAQALWKKFDARASHRVYNKGNACTGTRVLVIGAGPCGLRTAIEAQLLGSKVVVVEKRDRISRNNVLHLWPFVITDLRNLGAKKFYGKFCAGSIDHISIRQLQCILLKVALLLGVEVHEGVSFLNTIEPSDGCGWRAQISPEDHAVSHYEFDVLIGADGKRNTLEGFKRKEFRGKLAIAITANFINKKTEAEAKAEEISGVAFIFNQSFFKELYQTTGIDLENIVYYKDETHYFVMTAKKHSLIDKGVIIQDFADPAELLAPPNVNTDKLLDYAREAAEFSTKYQMPNLEFAVNHYGKPDVAMFDFTSMFAAETSCRVLVRKNYRLLQCLVGDSLLEPFWPTGSGCARGFLSSMDSAYAIKLWANTKNSILGVLAQRESIYRLLAQTTPENLHRDIGAYTVDPATRYPNLNRSTVNVWQVKHLVDTDDETILEQTFMDSNVIQTVAPEIPTRRKRRSGDTQPLSTVLLRWIKAQLHGHEFSHKLTELSECFTGGNVLCALINRYRPDLVDLNALKDCSPIECNEVAFKILESELNIPRIMSAKVSMTLENIDSKIWLNYLEQICEVFRGEIPHVKHPKLDFAKLKEKSTSNNAPDFSNLLKLSFKKSKSPLHDIDMTNVANRGRSVLDEEKLKRQRKAGLESNPVPIEVHKRAKKRRSHEKSGNIEERQQRLQEIEANRLDRQSRRRLQRFKQTENFYKSLHMLQAESFLRESDESSPFEDYSIYMYRQQAPEFNDRVKELERKLLHRDKDRGNQSALPRGTDEHFSDRIKSMEQRITSRNAAGTEKKPKDLLRAIGKIESSDWNIREIEKKIEQSKKTEIGRTKEKVPKWSKEQFVARQNKMSKPDRQESVEEKFKEIDQTLKNLDKQLKEGSVLEVGERGKNKVASIAGQFGKKEDTSEEKSIPLQKSPSKVGLVFNKQPASEKCHFCKQTVYVMEKISTEGLILHRSCLKCHHCHTNLRLGGYAFDRDDPVGRFYCTQHFRLPAKAERPVARRAPGEKRTHYHIPITKDEVSTPVRGRPDNVAQLDLLDRGQTPERIEFENVDAMSDGEPSLENIIDENEWTDRNFITGSEESESDLSSSDSSDEESDSDIFEEANGSPIGAQTLQLATDWIGKQRYSNIEDSDEEDFYDSSEGLLDDDAESQTEGEEFKKAREMRRQEVKLMPPPAYLPTDTETEVVSIADSQQTNIDNINGDIVNLKFDSETNLNAIINDLVLPNTERRVEGTSKTDMQVLERNLERKVSTEIDALNENLYNLNNLIKLNKEVVTLKRQNSVKDDIMKKLSLKEKWLNDTEAGNLLPANQSLDKEIVENIIEDIKKVELGEEGKGEDTRTLDMGKDLPKSDERKDGEKKEEIVIEKKIEDIKIDDKKENGTETVNLRNRRKTISDIKTGEEASELQKQFQLRRHSFKFPSDKEVVAPAANKSYEGSELQKKFEQRRQALRTPSDSDVGKLLYDAESRPPKHEENMNNALKNIEVKSFSDTMDTIKSLITTPKVTKQSSVDISKYFPNQKLEKSASVAKNVNQKTLKDVDLSKYFPKSPEPKRKEVSTVASRMSPSLRRKSDVVSTKNGTDLKGQSKILPPAKSSTNAPKDDSKKPPKAKVNSLKKPIPKRNALAPQNKVETTNGNGITKSDSDLDIFDQLLDGAMDINAGKSTVTSKSPKIVRKTSKNDGSNTKKKKGSPSPNSKFKKKDGIEKVLDANEQIFEEILQTDETRSPSVEYQKLFNEEKSPSADLSDRIEQILIDNNTTPSNPKVPVRKKKLAKQSKTNGSAVEIDGNTPKTNQDGTSTSNQSCPPLNESHAKIIRNTQNIPSANNVSKGNSMDLDINFEKTMEYLKTDWRKEAEKFLQKKKDSFYAKRRGEDISDSEEEDFGEHIINQPLVSKKLENVEEESLSETEEILNGIIDDMRKETTNENANEFIEDILDAEKQNLSISKNKDEIPLSDSQETLVGTEFKLKTDHQNDAERTEGEDVLPATTIPDKEADLIEKEINENVDSVKVEHTIQSPLENDQSTTNQPSNENLGNAIDEPKKDADIGNKDESDKKEQVLSNKVLSKMINIVDDVTTKGLNILPDLIAANVDAPRHIPSSMCKENDRTKDDLKIETLNENIEAKPDTSEKTSAVFDKPENNVSVNISIPDKLPSSGNETPAPEKTSLDIKLEQNKPISDENSSKDNQKYSIQFNKVMAELGSMSKLLKETKRPIVPKRLNKIEKPALDSGTKDCPKAEECKNDLKTDGNGPLILNNVPKIEEKQKLPVDEKQEPKSKQNKIDMDSDDSLSDIELNDLEVEQLINEIMHEFGETKEVEKEVLIDELLSETVEAKPLELTDEMAADSSKPTTESTEEYSKKTIEKSPSEDSIERLFNEFADDMLVDVEFDSNDEIISIIPKGKVAKEEGDLIRKNINISPDIDSKPDELVSHAVENDNSGAKCTLSDGSICKETSNAINEITSQNTDNEVNKPISLDNNTAIKPSIMDVSETNKDEVTSTTSINNLLKEQENRVQESISNVNEIDREKNNKVDENKSISEVTKSVSPPKTTESKIAVESSSPKTSPLRKNSSSSLKTPPLRKNSTNEVDREKNDKVEDIKPISPSSEVCTTSVPPPTTTDAKIDVESSSPKTSPLRRNSSSSLKTPPLRKNSANEVDREKNDKVEDIKPISPSSEVCTTSVPPPTTTDAKIDVESSSPKTSPLRRNSSSSLKTPPLRKNSTNEVDREKNDKVEDIKPISPSSEVCTTSVPPPTTTDSKIDVESTSPKTSPLRRNSSSSLKTPPLRKNSTNEVDREKNDKVEDIKPISPSSEVCTKSVSPPKTTDAKIDVESSSPKTSPLRRNSSSSLKTPQLRKNSANEIGREQNDKVEDIKPISPSSEVCTKSVSPPKTTDSKIDVESSSPKTSPLRKNSSSSLKTPPLRKNSANEIDREKNDKVEDIKPISPSSEVCTTSVPPPTTTDSKIDVESSSPKTSPLRRNSSSSLKTPPLRKNSTNEVDREKNDKVEDIKPISPSSEVCTKSVSPPKTTDAKIDVESSSPKTSPLRRNSSSSLKTPQLRKNSANEIGREQNDKVEDIKPISPSSEVCTKSVSPPKTTDSKIDVESSSPKTSPLRKNSSSSLKTPPLRKNSTNEVDREKNDKVEDIKPISPSSEVCTTSVPPPTTTDAKIDVESSSPKTSPLRKNSSSSLKTPPLRKNSANEIDREKNDKVEDIKPISPSSEVNTKSVSPPKTTESKIDVESSSPKTSPLRRNSSSSLKTPPLRKNSANEIGREQNDKVEAIKSISPSSEVNTKSVSPPKTTESKIDVESSSPKTSPLRRNSSSSLKTPPLRKNSANEIGREQNDKVEAIKSISPSSEVNTKSVSPPKTTESKIDVESSSPKTSPLRRNSSSSLKTPPLRKNSANEIGREQNDKVEAIKSISPSSEVNTKSVSPPKTTESKIDVESSSPKTSPLRRNSSSSLKTPPLRKNSANEIGREQNDKVEAIKSISPSSVVSSKSVSPNNKTDESTASRETVSPIRPLRKNQLSVDDDTSNENALKENKESVSSSISTTDIKMMSKSAKGSPEIESTSLYPIRPLRKYDRTVDIDKKNDNIISSNSSDNSKKQYSEVSRRITPPINEKMLSESIDTVETKSISPVKILPNYDACVSIDDTNLETKTTSTCDLPTEKYDKRTDSTSPTNNNEITESIPTFNDNGESCFPIKPFRRNKSYTSSTSPEPPNAPTRGRRLSQKLSPADMPPSVQDILRDIENNSEKAYFINLIDETSPKFPIMKDEEDETQPIEETKPRTLPRTKRSKSREKEPLTELEYIERLEMERMEALIKRDEMYASRNKPVNLTYAEVLKENINDRTNYSGQDKKYYSSPSISPRQYSESNPNRDFTSSPVSKPNSNFDDGAYNSSLIKEKTISSSPLTELPSAKTRIKRQYSEENPRREIISTSPINSFNKETHVSADSIFSPSKSIMSRSSEQIPHRSYQRISNPMDRGTQILLDRSKMLHDMKEDFMTEKNAGNNPYLKKMISTEKICPDVEEYIIQNKPRDERPRKLFPTSRSIESKRYLNRTPEFSTSTSFARPHSLASSTQSPRNFVEYFKKSPSHHKERGRSKDSCVVQSDSESSSADDVELNSATEISTDSEFDHDPIIREAPRIFIDDTHLRKPTKVQVKQGIITSSPNHKVTTTNNQIQTALKQQELEFKPLVQVDPSLLNSNRMPLKNPRPGDYLLNKTPSTEGIASKKSLELKKRYLLGEQGIGNGIMKSGSTSILDSKFKNFHSNISECQKLLNPGSDISPSMKTFLDRTKIGDKVVNKSEILKKDIDEKENVLKNNLNNKNKGKDYSETVNTALVENISKEIKSPVIIETIDLTTPEKSVPIIDLTTIEIPSTMVKANQEFIEKLEIAENIENDVIVIEDSPLKKEAHSLDEQDAVEENKSSEKPDVSKDVKEIKPDIITQIEENKVEKECILPKSTVQTSPVKDDLKPLCPSNENDVQETSIEVPNIPWNINKTKSDVESDSLSSSSSSLEDIPHFILDSTTSPDTHNEQIVPRVEVHDTSGALMQIDSLMIIDGKYIGDPEDLKHMEIPAGTKIELPKEKPEETLAKEEVKDTLMSSPSKPDLKFDTRNENKIDTLKNLPLLLEQSNENVKLVKPTTLELSKTRHSSVSSDKDKTPTAEHAISDSETEVTGQVLTETELSDWTADDVVSENFVDIEFALNSNKGTIKRNKKGRKKHLPKLQHLHHQQQSSPAPPKILDSPKDCGILRNLDIEEIEFMDTGSEGSCAEAYAATNKAMLQNRGYIEFIENTPPPSIPLQVAENEIKSSKAEIYSSNTESTSKEILGIDYIEQGACILSNDIDLKTPVNEIPSIFVLKQPQTQFQLPSTMTDSINDIDDDSLALINSQGATNTTTTEDSDALTVVTSPCEPGTKNLDNQNTPSSSEKNDKTLSSSGTKIPVRKTSGDEIRRRTQEDINKRKDSDELSYEEYVRKLQMKITQISNARDSIDIRKQKRKSSKGEMIENTQNNSVIENKSLSIFEPPKGTVLTTSNNNQAQQVHKVPEIPTLTRKLEEITKERTKQKDLIHDLVMDKLQSKKQLNAEKRLNRSRNRNMFNCSGISVPTTPKVASNGCTNSPHYHITCADRRSSKENLQKNQSIVKPKNSPKENKEIIQSFKNSPRSKQRPLSDNLDQIISFDQTPKLSKTRSFCVYNTAANPTKDSPTDQRKPFFATPLAPPRISKKLDDPPSSAHTEKLRADARARARLKSNQELGLSPEEKLQLLRKRYHIELHEAADGGSSKNKSDDIKARDRKMVTSKSVNDISAVHTHLNSDENFDTKPVMPLGDFTSDPNLSQGNQTKSSRRRKDPERRKSLIQTVSNFFNKKKEKEVPSPAKEKPEGVFSRFRISPKTKEKSKEKEGLPFDGISSQDCLKYEVTSYSSSPQLCKTTDDTPPPPIPPLPLNYQRSDDESYTTESREQKKQRAISKASRQAELKRLRIAQEIQREQEEIEVKLKELEARGVLIEKALRGEGQNMENIETSSMGANDEKLLKELLEICRNTTQLKKRDEELGIRQQELQLEHRHAQLKEELNIRLSYSKLDKSSADVAAEGAILNEMLEIVAKRAALRPNETGDLLAEDDPDV